MLVSNLVGKDKLFPSSLQQLFTELQPVLKLQL